MSQGPEFDGCDVERCLRSGPVTNWYLGTQREVGRRVVIKSLSENVLPQSPFALPLEREARILGRLQHPGVIALYDLVKRERRMWLLREYVEGGTLAEVLQERGTLEIAPALAIALQVAEALAYVHANGIVHRDVQPRNLLVSRAGEVKVSNFFLATERASVAPPELLEGNSGFAEPHYMSPEQVLGEPPDPRSDLFSLGVVLHEALSGQHPFAAPDRRSTTQRIRHDPPTELPKRLGVPPSVERLLQRALQKVPSDRFADAREMSVSLQQCLHEAVGERSPLAVVVESLKSAPGGEPKPRSKPHAETLPHREFRPFRVSLYIALFVLLLGGVWLIRRSLVRDELQHKSADARLPLRPSSAGSLRVLARPWAEIHVDGQTIGTTPIADSIPLATGVHYVMLVHPDADPVHRRIVVGRDQPVLLDVEMPVRTPPETITSVPSPPVSPPDAGSLSP